MYGLAVRWSLEVAPADAADRLRDYVTTTSLATFTGMDGLRFKTWRQRPGEWFEGTYVFETAAARDGFEASFRAKAPTAPVTVLIGSPPASIERFEVVAVAEGGAGFAAGPGPGPGPGPGSA
ncbi:MAG TPA: hypothetical protein VHN80_11830 [Kineosporiaceae bacterium]|nr:hypothetical protein [Kineosporiaceae bacterium]